MLESMRSRLHAAGSLNQNGSGQLTGHRYHRLVDEQRESIKTLPSQIYPNVPSAPIQPRLKLEDYEGTYHHPGYGNFTISLTPPTSGKINTSSPIGGLSSGTLPLYTWTKYENILYTLHHVSGEYWLVELRSYLHNGKLADGITKGRFEIGASGAVDKFAVVLEPSVEGEQGWCIFERIV